MATELGVAYISVVPDTRKLRSGIEQALNGVEKTGLNQGRNYGKSFGTGASGSMDGAARSSARRFSDTFESEANTRATRIGSAVGTILGRAVVGAAGVAAAGLGAVLFKGLDRYKSLDATAHRLGAMGKTAGDVKAIMADINEVVEGTPIALDEASKSASQFLAAGVKQGKPLKDMLKSIADAAGFSGDSFDSIAQGFIQVNNAGKVTAEDIQNQFRNLPVIPWLAKSMGTDPASIKTMISDGKIGVQNLIDAVEQNAGGMAKAAGDTIDGALRNMSTGLAKTGANLLSALFGDPLDTTSGPGGMVEALNKVNAKIADLNNWVIAHKDEIKQFFTDAANTAKDLAAKVGQVLGFLKEHPGAIQAVVVAFGAWKAIEGVAALATSLKAITTLLKVGIPAAAAEGAAGATAGLAGITAPGWLLALLGAGGVAAAGIGTGQVVDAGGDITTSRFGSRPGHSGAPSGLPGLNGGLIPGGGGPGAQQQRRGVAPGDPTGGLLGGAVQGQALPSAASMAGIAKAQALNGLPYIPGSTDCSGYLSQVYSAMVGKNVHFTTMADFEALGFKRGYMPGALNIGNIPKPGNSGHMAGTLPNGVNIESGGSSGPVSYNSGPGAMGKQFSEQWYFMPGMATGGGIRGPGSGTSDDIPAMLSNGEHVLTARDVAAMGGQAGVYAFRNMLHRSGGGSILPMGQIPWPPGKIGKTGAGDGDVPNLDSGSNPNQKPLPWLIDPDSPIPKGPPGLPLPPTGDDTLFPELQPWWMREWLKRNHNSGWDGKRIVPFADGGAVGPGGGGKMPIPDEQLLQMLQQGADPGQLIAQGADPAQIQKLAGQAGGGSGPSSSGRTQGYMPAGAMNTAPTTGGIAGSLYDMAGQAVQGAIQIAADMGKMAASGATMGAGGPAAGAGIQAGADAAKRGVQYGFDMAGIWTGAIGEILNPFGMPRWLSDVNPMSFMPQGGIQGAATTTAEQAVLDQQNQQNQKPYANADQQQKPYANAPEGPQMQSFDQFAQATPTPGVEPSMNMNGGNTYNVYANNSDEAMRQLKTKERLSTLQYAGRP